MNPEIENQYRTVAFNLEQIANRFGKGSDEELALKKAGWALAYIFTNNQWHHFENFVVKNETHATEDEIRVMHEHLRSMGINPDSP